jgi:hypothetical protein
MKTKDWIIEKLKENDFNSVKVSSMYDDYCRNFSTPCKEDSYKRQVRLYSSENKVNLNVVEPIKDSIKEEFNNDIYSAFVSSNWVKTPEDLIKHLNIDINIWELTKFTRNYWGSEKNPNFQVKGEFKKKKQEFNEKVVLESIKKAVSEFIPKKIDVFKTQRINTSENIVEIDLADHHYGQQSLESETGEEYNLEISRDLAIKSVYNLCQQSAIYNPEKILLVLGNDFFNSDNSLNTTFAGTQQAECSRWQKTFESGLFLCVALIELCREFADEVEVKIVQGNHDFTKIFYMGCALKQRYIHTPEVLIDNSEMIRKYFIYGNNLICFTHGDKEVNGKLPMIIAKEQPEAFAECKNIEVHSGHLHKEKESLVFVDEDCSIKERVLPSLVARSDWASGKGYFHIRESQAFVWNKEFGNIAIFKYHI